MLLSPPLLITACWHYSSDRSVPSPTLSTLGAGMGSFLECSTQKGMVHLGRETPKFLFLSHTLVSSITFLSHVFPHLKKSLPFWSHPHLENGPGGSLPSSLLHFAQFPINLLPNKPFLLVPSSASACTLTFCLDYCKPCQYSFRSILLP